jgi:ABC-2 type transport system permease protein
VLLFFIVYAFTVDIYNAGSGVTLQLNNAAFAVLDTDRSAASRELAGRFQPPHFNPLGLVGQESQGLSLLDNSDALFVLDIPPQFERTLARRAGHRADAGGRQQLGAGHAGHGRRHPDRGQLRPGDGHRPPGLCQHGTGQIAGVPMISNVPRVWFNPNQNDAWFMAISELLNVITVFAILLPAAAMVREKERGTIEQLIVSPLTPFQVMAPKVLAMTGVILAATALSLGRCWRACSACRCGAACCSSSRPPRCMSWPCRAWACTSPRSPATWPRPACCPSWCWRR